MSVGSHRTVSLRFAAVFGLGVLVYMAGHAVFGAAASEYAVKAAYLYNFGRFVDWPPNASGSQSNEFTICVLGRDPFGSALDETIAGEKINNKSVAARRISKAADASGCRILFISSSEDKRLKETLSTVSPLGVLTVSDMPEFVERGGMVQFVVEANRVRFAINLAAAQQAGLSLSSELLKVATAVRGKS